ncbi:uncharacterized protein LOC112685571 [Sipha flava]|uniref:Uncharacterized protein LOC112685571 n=1 Tax=Sipha flava TaxID=143950 RepID=A0A8B8FQS0_9HEMI|nr:uncharacterized protein LOC112685571 [Sipha flava]
MSFKILHRPQPFSDDLDQDVESFFDNYELAAIINEWGDHNSTIDNIENNLRKYELSILIRSKDDKGNKDTERLEKERDVLKNHLQKLSMGQLDINNRRNDAGKKLRKESLTSSNINKLNIHENKTCETRSINRLLRQCEKGPQVPGDGDFGAHALAPTALRLSLIEQTELQRQVDELLQAGLIVPSNSFYASPAFLVKKTDGTKRLIIDYRQLNKQVPH